MSEIDESINTSQVGERRVCSDCIGDKYLKKVVNRCGEDDLCFYCYETAKTVAVKHLAVHVKRFFYDHYVLNKHDPEIGPRSDYLGNVFDIIDMETGVSMELAGDLQNELISAAIEHDGDIMESDNPFDKYAEYFEKDIDSQYWDSLWNDLKRTISKENRLFNERAKKILETVFFNIIRVKSDRTEKDYNVVEIGPNTNIPSLYRAREFQSEESLYEALMYPDIELGPPPPSRAIEGRMSANGISMFYGATNVDVAIAEIRPAVGSRVIVANFDIIKNLRLLDVVKLQSALPVDSLFKPSQKRILEKRKFISSLSKLISAPVMPADQSTDYLITQAISDYLSGLRSPTSIDGIIYNSAQKGNETTNVALFHKASRVKLRNRPERSSVSLGFDNIFLSGDDKVYDVSEIFANNSERNFNIGGDVESSDSTDEDCREQTLKLDPLNISVHLIESVEFNTSIQKVNRLQLDKNFKPIKFKERE